MVRCEVVVTADEAGRCEYRHFFFSFVCFYVCVCIVCGIATVVLLYVATQ